jgi:predicted nucleotidyltransferase
MTRTFDPILNQIIVIAEEKIQPKRILLFGSRARGTHTSRSDYDLAFDVPGIDHIRWVNFLDVLEECVPTLNSFDCIRLSDPIEQELLRKVEQEGILIYEKRNLLPSSSS